MIPKIEDAWDSYMSLHAQGRRIYEAGNECYEKANAIYIDDSLPKTEGNRLCSEGNRLRSQGNQICALGGDLYHNAVVSKYGKSVAICWVTGGIEIRSKESLILTSSEI